MKFDLLLVRTLYVAWRIKSNPRCCIFRVDALPCSCYLTRFLADMHDINLWSVYIALFLQLPFAIVLFLQYDYCIAIAESDKKWRWTTHRFENACAQKWRYKLIAIIFYFYIITLQFCRNELTMRNLLCNPSTPPPLFIYFFKNLWRSLFSSRWLGGMRVFFG